ncbi:MAG: ABC transporter permease, partial [Ghiorsea sp.]|nr:ABC transporter permease [Ghiorsea sp.]
MLQTLKSNPLMLTGAIIVAFVSTIAIFAPWLAPYDPDHIVIRDMLLSPSAEHWCGTDTLGRDVFSRLLYGARISLLVGLVAVGIALLVGIILGAIAGYAGGLWDNIIMRWTDMVLCFPTFFLILAVIAFLEPSIWNIM